MSKTIRQYGLILTLVCVLATAALGAVKPTYTYAATTKVTTTSKKSKAKINLSSIKLVKGNTKKLKVTKNKGKVTWSSSNTSVATVSSSGTVKAVAGGKATIKAKVDGKTLKCKVTVISINNVKATLSVGQTWQLKVINGKNTKWSSANKSIATVSSKGLLKAKKTGKTTITCKTNGKTLKCKVYVPAINSTSATLKGIGATKQLTIKNYYGKLEWSSSDCNIASVDNTGLVTVNRAGNATITCMNNGRPLKCKIKAIALNHTSLILDGDKMCEQLKCQNYTGTVTWTSSDSSVAAVSSTGFVTAGDDGSAVITCKAGTNTFTCLVNVNCGIKVPYANLPSNTNVTRLAIDIPYQYISNGVPRKGVRTYTIYNQAAASNQLKDPVTVAGVKTDLSTYIKVHGCAISSFTSVLGGFAPSIASSLTPVIKPEAGPASSISSTGFEHAVFGKKWETNYLKESNKQMPISLLGIQQVLNHYKIKSQYVQKFRDQEAVDMLRSHLKRGNPVLFLVGQSRRTFGSTAYVKDSKWANSYHTMAMLGLTEIDGQEMVIVADSMNRTNTSVHNPDQQRIKYATLEELVCFMFSNTEEASSPYFQSKSKSGGFVLVNPN